MNDGKKLKIESVSSNDSEIFSLSEDSFFSNLSDIEDLRSTIPSEDEIAAKKLQAVLKITELLMTTYDINEIFKIIMDKAIELTSAERGYLILFDSNGEMNVAYTMNMEVEDKQDALKQVSKTVINQVVEEKRVITIKNALKDEEYEVQMSIVNLKLKSVMCAPMIVKDKVIGIIYVENRTVPGIFNSEAAELIKFFGNQCGVAIENYRLIKANKEYSESLEKMVEERTHELQNQKKYTENVLENIGELLITIDINQKILTVNKALEGILKLESSSFVGKQLSELYDKDNYQELIKACKSDKVIPNIPCYIRNSENQKISINATVSPIFENKETIGFIIINKDMTEIEKFEKERLERKELESITNAAVTANDQINTPLGVIIGRAEILKKFVKDDSKARKNIETIKEQAYRIRNTMDEMKKLTAIKTKNYKLNGITMLDLNKKE